MVRCKVCLSPWQAQVLQVQQRGCRELELGEVCTLQLDSRLEAFLMYVSADTASSSSRNSMAIFTNLASLYSESTTRMPGCGAGPRGFMQQKHLPACSPEPGANLHCVHKGGACAGHAPCTVMLDNTTGAATGTALLPRRRSTIHY